MLVADALHAPLNGLPGGWGGLGWVGAGWVGWAADRQQHSMAQRSTGSSTQLSAAAPHLRQQLHHALDGDAVER